MVPVSKEEVLELLDKGMIVDASPGGIVFGNRHSEGGIVILQLIGNTIFKVAEMEGGEFLVNCLAREKNLKRLEEIISYHGDDNGLTPDEVRGLRHYIVPSGHFVYVGRYSGSIISRAGTRRFLDELVEMNEATAGIFLPDTQK